MERDFEDKYHILEEDHWWFKGRRDCIIQMMRYFSKDAKILDVGCSSGVLLTELKNQLFNPLNLYGIDVSEKAIQACHDRGFTNTSVMDAQELNLKERPFDILIASDCLEHLEDDVKALTSWRSQLKEDGTLFIFVPAFMSLWSGHDIVNHHYRRYTKNQLMSKLEKSNFNIINSGYWNFTLFFPLFLIRKIKKLLNLDKINDLNYLPKFINELLYFILFLENRMLKLGRFPVGISVYCIAQKNKKS